MEENRSESIEMYLKSVAELGGVSQPVPIGRVAERLGVTSVSANEMMKRLVTQGLITHLPYKGVVLTREGRRSANNVIRRQRLWECFLVDKLELDWAKAHELACDLEHATTAEVAQALEIFLDHPTRCPHGNPIPPPDSELDPTLGNPLSGIGVGQSVRIRAIRPEKEEVMAYLYDRGIVPGQRVTVEEIAPLQGPMTLRLDQRMVVIGQNLAELVLVDEE